MENASNALRIAGGILIGVLLISLFVAFYYNIRSFMVRKENDRIVVQYEDFNKQFDVYAKDVYGSDVLSLTNKIQDYNMTEVGDKGYSRMDVAVTFYVDISSKVNGVDYGFKKGRYTTIQIENKMNTLQNTINFIGNKEYSGYKVSKLAYMRTIEQEQIIEKTKITEAKNNINNYIILNSLEKTIKSTVFRFVKAEYDSNTGRFKLIEYKL